MSGIKKILTMSAFILLIMAVLIGCPMLLKDSTIKNGQYIELNIGSESAAKAITVTEYDVTKLEIEIYDPQGALIKDFSWFPDEGQQSYLIPVTGEGEHEIVVTHISDDNGTVIEAEESAFFNIEAMVITAINIVPGLIGYIDISPGNDDPLEPIDLTGYWDLTLYLDSEEVMGPFEFYIGQTGSDLYATPGEPEYAFTGTIDELAVSFTGAVGALIGTVSSDGNEISGSFSESPYGSGTFVFVRSSPFGSIVMNGICAGVPISLDTIWGRGSLGIEDWENVSFDVNLGSDPDPVIGGLMFSGGALFEGHYVVTAEWDEEEENPQLQATLWVGYDVFTFSSGDIHITECVGNHMVGNFNLMFPDGSNLSGWFDLELNGTGESFVNGTWPEGIVAAVNPFLSFSQFEFGTMNNISINYWDLDLNVDIWFNVPGQVSANSSYSMPDQLWGHLNWESVSGPSVYQELAVPSTLILDSYDENGMAGSFQLSFAGGGTVIGSFDVSREEMR